MENVRFLFDDTDPNNLIRLRHTFYICMSVISALVIAQYVGTYLLFGFVVAFSPDGNRTTGCPHNMSTCSKNQKLLCYQEDMSRCHFLGFIFLCVVILLVCLVTGICLSVILLFYGICREIYLFIQYCNTTSVVLKNDEELPITGIETLHK